MRKVSPGIYLVRHKFTELLQLLRKFHDLMLSNPLETDEECAICMSPMEVGKALR